MGKPRKEFSGNMREEKSRGEMRIYLCNECFGEKLVERVKKTFSLPLPQGFLPIPNHIFNMLQAHRDSQKIVRSWAIFPFN